MILCDACTFVLVKQRILWLDWFLCNFNNKKLLHDREALRYRLLAILYLVFPSIPANMY